jgi:ubiquinone/menaquinone biosynthesis C-methylase UbiE
MPHFNFGYFKSSTNRKLKPATIKKKMLAWKKNKAFYDGSREDGYGGFKYDGRWLKILPKIIKRYKLNSSSRVLEIGCKKGFLVHDLKKLVPGISCTGIEDHLYPIKKCKKEVKKFIKYSNFTKLPFKKNSFDCIIAISSIYTYNFGDLIKIFNEIKRVSKNNKILITLASYENIKDLEKLLNWTTLSTVILKKKDWMKLFKEVGYKGDYFFTDAKILGLK